MPNTPPSPPTSTVGRRCRRLASPPSSRTRARRRRAGDRAPRGGRAGRRRRARVRRRRRPARRHRRRSGRRRHDAPRARAVPRHRHPGDRRQLRPRRVPDRDHGRRARGGPARACSPATTRPSSWRRSRSTSEARRRSPSTTSSSRGDARPDGRAGARDRRRGARRAAMRRPDLRDAGRLDRVQPLERRAGAGAGASTRWCSRSSRRMRSTSRPLVVPRGPDRRSRNRTPGLDASVLVDGHEVGRARARRAGRRRVGRAAEPARDAAGGDRSSAGTAPPSATEHLRRARTMSVCCDAANREPRADP